MTTQQIYLVKFIHRKQCNKNWWLGIDPNTEDLENTVAYPDELVVYNSQLYKATTNMIAGAFNTANWELQNTPTDSRYIPNDPGIELENDSTPDQTIWSVWK